MTDEYRVVKQTNWIGWLALLLSALALVMAMVAYNRAGGDVSDDVQQTTNTVTDKATDATDNVEKAVDNGPDGVDDGAQ